MDKLPKWLLIPLGIGAAYLIYVAVYYATLAVLASLFQLGAMLLSWVAA